MVGLINQRDYFEAILEEQRRGMIVAEQEREKAAKALRDELARSIQQGDDALHDHIQQQLAQIRENLVSAEKLEVQRIGEVKALIAATHREVDIAFAASERAIQKAEKQNDQAFRDANEWRGQSADRELTQRQQMSDLTATFLPREVAEAQFQELRTKVEDATKALNIGQGVATATARQQDRVQPWQLWLAATLVAGVEIIARLVH